jgi:hypothetical protein
MITLWWNHCEQNFFLLCCLVFNLPPRIGWITAHDIGDVSMANKIKEMMKVQPPQADEEALLGSCLDVYDACRQNRSSLTHFTAQASAIDPTNLTEATFVRMKGPSAQPVPLPSSLADIRRVAFEIKTFTVYLWKTYAALLVRAEGQPATLLPQ